MSQCCDAQVHHAAESRYFAEQWSRHSAVIAHKYLEPALLVFIAGISATVRVFIKNRDASWNSSVNNCCNELNKMTPHSQSNPPKRSKVWLLWLLIAIAIGTCLVCWYIASLQEDPAKFGDMFGLANALFSGLAFAGLIYTVVLQKEELALQREELAATRTELHAQTEHFGIQNQTLAKQSAEQTFFQLLRLHNDITSAIDLKRSGVSFPRETGVVPLGGIISQGRDCFKSFFNTLRDRYSLTDADLSPLERIEAAYFDFYNEHQADLGHYFRGLYNLVKYTDLGSFDDRRVYTNLIRAQLSNYELCIIFYNCLSSFGREKFKPLVEKYGLLKHVPEDLLFTGRESLSLYSAGAYG
jgi:hypothetical protein